MTGLAVSGDRPEIRRRDDNSGPPPGNGAPWPPLGHGARRLPLGHGAPPGAGDSGLRWSFEFDLEGVLAAIGRPLEGYSGADQEEILAAELAASDRDGGGRSADLAGVVAEIPPAAGDMTYAPRCGGR